ncbi:MAG: response regulator [Treponema sp.]|jgi:signal transduction histidine kinase/CheY-like chemotaxis protein|nr:response regulator [Treponema sp.]
MEKRSSITTTITFTAALVVIILTVWLGFAMLRIMNLITDTILIRVLQTAAKTAAESVEGNLHTMADRFFMIRGNAAFVDAKTGERRALLDYIATGIEFVWLGLYRNDGFLQEGSIAAPIDIADREIFQKITQTGKLAIDDTSVGFRGLEIAMGIPVGVRGESWYLLGSYRYDVLSDTLNNVNINARGFAFIINHDGKLIAHRDLDRVFGQEPITATLGSGAEALGVVELMKHGQTGSAGIEGNGERIFISYAPIRGTLWSLGIVAPRRDFVAPLQRAILISVIIIAAVIVSFVIIFNTALTRILSHPLHAITENARNLAGGKFAHTLPEKVAGRTDEIGRLGTAFVTMTNTIRSVNQDIRSLADTVRRGSMNDRADPASYPGDYHLIISGLNSMLDIFCSHLNAMPNALALFNQDKKCIYLNQTMEDILESHRFDKNDPALISTILDGSKETGSDFMEALALSLFIPDTKSGETRHAELVIPDRVGDDRSYTLTLRRVAGEDGAEFGCVMMILSDVTMLARARREAEAASSAKGNFLANMSHEMRTPMNAVIGMTSLAKSATDMKRKDYCLGKIEEASVHLLGVINDVLDMSKIEANKFDLSSTDFNFEKLIQRVADVIHPKLDEKQQDFNLRLDPNIPPSLIGDEQRLAQVITNLLSNAVKFTPEKGAIRLIASAIKDEQDIFTLKVEVIDSGIGISDEQKAKLFGSFQQADSSISRRFGGTGLGLAISKRIVEMMGGGIWVHSKVNEGSTFGFTFQVKRGTETRKSLLKEGVNRSNLRILAVDDNEDARYCLSDFLRLFSLQGDVASGGKEALALIQKNGPYDLYFVDWKMPDMDGIELSRRIKEAEGNNGSHQSVIILISSGEWSAIEGEANKAGIDRFLSKPLFPSSIADIINDCLGADSEHIGKGEEAHDNFKGFRLLLAEDIEINREIVLALLEPTELDIDCAENGVDALDKFAKNPDAYDMIFMDVQMPEMDGYEATRRIRAFENSGEGAEGSPSRRARHIPIVAMTANVFQQDIEQCLAAGMNDHVGKPLDLNEVLAKLRKYLPQGIAGKAV